MIETLLRPSIKLNKGLASIKLNEVRSRSPDPRDWDPGGETVKSRDS